MGRDATIPGHETGGGRSSPALAIAGFLMLLTVFLQANPRFGVIEAWPWELFSIAGPMANKAVLVAWAALALWALLMAFTTQARLRLAVGLLLFAVLMPQLTARGSGFELQYYTFIELLAFVAIGGGLLLAGSDRGDGTAEAGRLLLLAGALTVLVRPFVIFPPEAGEISYARTFLQELEVFVTTGDPEAIQPDRANSAWFETFPHALLSLGALLSLIVALGLRHVVLRWTAFGLVVLGLAMPSQAQVFLLRNEPDLQAARVLQHVVAGFIAYGLAPFLMGSALIGDFANRGREEAL